MYACVQWMEWKAAVHFILHLTKNHSAEKKSNGMSFQNIFCICYTYIVHYIIIVITIIVSMKKEKMFVVSCYCVYWRRLSSFSIRMIKLYWCEYAFSTNISKVYWDDQREMIKKYTVLKLNETQNIDVDIDKSFLTYIGWTQIRIYPIWSLFHIT